MVHPSRLYYGKYIQGGAGCAPGRGANHGGGGSLTAAGSNAEAIRVLLGADFRHRDYSVYARPQSSSVATLRGDGPRRSRRSLGRHFFSSNVLVYAAAIFACGALCAVLRMRTAYRFAAITVSIILLIAHQKPAWIVASHRFVEVSVGIAVALVVAAVWPSRG